MNPHDTTSGNQNKSKLRSPCTRRWRLAAWNGNSQEQSPRWALESAPFCDSRLQELATIGQRRARFGNRAAHFLERTTPSTQYNVAQLALRVVTNEDISTSFDSSPHEGTESVNT